MTICFVFVGALNTGMKDPIRNEKEEEISILVDGSSLKKSKLIRMSQFLSSSLEDLKRGEKTPVWNLFNDGVLEKDFLSSKLSEEILSYFLPLCAEEIKEKWNKASSFSSYVHSEIPALSSHSIYTSFDPSCQHILEEIKKNQKVEAKQAFSLLSKAFEAHRKIPPEMVRRVLMHRQKQQEKQGEQQISCRFPVRVTHANAI